MTEQNTNQYPPFHNNNGIPQFQPAPQPPKKKRWFTKPLVWVPALALLCGVGVGAGSVEPEIQTVEKVVEKPVDKIVTKTVEKDVEVTPASCLKALDTAQQALSYSSESMGYMNDALQAAAKFDVAGIEAANADLEVLTPKIQALTSPMQISVADCRSKAK